MKRIDPELRWSFIIISAFVFSLFATAALLIILQWIGGR